MCVTVSINVQDANVSFWVPIQQLADPRGGSTIAAARALCNPWHRDTQRSPQMPQRIEREGREEGGRPSLGDVRSTECDGGWGTRVLTPIRAPAKNAAKEADWREGGTHRTKCLPVWTNWEKPLRIITRFPNKGFAAVFPVDASLNISAVQD